jgi:drug/metabolite transporter (DMT)-like permease
MIGLTAMAKRAFATPGIVNRSRPYLMLAIIIILWGMNFVVSRFLAGLEPVRVSGILFAMFRYLFGALTMVSVIAYQRLSLGEITAEIRPYRGTLLLSAFLSAVFVMTTHMSTEYASSGTTSIIVNLSPIVVLFYGILFLSERINIIKISGFLLGLAGGLLFLWTTLMMTPGLEIGLILALIAMLSWGAYTIVLHYLEGANRYIVMTVKHAASTLMIIPFIVLLILDGHTLILVWDAWSIAGILFSGVLGSGLAYVLYFSAIEILGAARASSFLFLVPFVSLAGDFALGEPPEVLALIAGVIAIVGVALVKFSDNDESDDQSTDL